MILGVLEHLELELLLGVMGLVAKFVPNVNQPRLEVIENILSYVIQNHKDKYDMFSLICHSLLRIYRCEYI